MTEHGFDINWFKHQMIWFLIFITFAECTITVNSASSHAVGALPPPSATQVFPFSRGAPSAPVTVELPALTRAIALPIATKTREAVAAPTRSTPSNGSEAAVQFALAQLGKPYRWGASGPAGYDCSGLVMVAFSRIGLSLPHFTGALIGYGHAVARNALQRGDIVFPSNHHVAIYIGDNRMVEAPQPGQVIKISSVYAFYAARRLV